MYRRWSDWPVRRKVGLFAAGGLASLGFESLIAHFADNPAVRPAQFVPPVFSLLCVVILVVSLFVLRAQALDRALRIIAPACILVGAVGTGFHWSRLLQPLGNHPLTWKNVETSLSLSPPVFAPGGFMALGLLLLVLPKILPETGRPDRPG